MSFKFAAIKIERMRFSIIIALFVIFTSQLRAQIGSNTDKATFAKTIHFDFNSTTPNAAEWQSLKAEFVGLDRGIRINLIGHADNIGSSEVNLKIARKRAEAIKALLIQLGFDAELIQIQNMGESKPIDSNETETGRSNNRRVEISVR